MTEELPAQRPEGKLLHDALQTKGQSIRQVAAQAGMSDARWRQIVKGYMHFSGVLTEVIAPPQTLARMAQAVGVKPDQLVAAGREDAAYALENMDLVLDREKNPPDTKVAHRRSADRASDEIELIYASSMTARQKLEAIRKVLRLQEEAKKEDAGQKQLRTASSKADE